MSTYNEAYGGAYTLLLYENLGRGDLADPIVISSGWDAASFATPLRIP